MATRPRTSDKSDPEYRPWNDPTVKGLSEADLPDEQQATIDVLVAALSAVRWRVSGKSIGFDIIDQIDAALALARA